MSLGICGCRATLESKRLRDVKPAAIELICETPGAVAQVDSTAGEEPVVWNVNGKDMYFMRAAKDENGEDVACRVLDAVVVSARFRNVAERMGKVRVEFQINVPEELQNSDWQLRYSPTIFLQGDSLKLDKVYITGSAYRKRQLRGYQQYQRFLDSIINDSTLFIDLRSLEIFLMRNIPEIYAFRSDSSYVSDEQFNSAFGINRLSAMEHYTDKGAMARNEKKKLRKEAMFTRYVKAPIDEEGIRLDSVIHGPKGELTYRYIQEIPTRPGLKKMDLVLDGEIYRQDKKLGEIARSEKLSFYVSALNFFVDDNPRFIRKVIERSSTSTHSYRLSFKTGSAVVDTSLAANGEIARQIESRLIEAASGDLYILDSVTFLASASPEGSVQANNRLSKKRSEAIGNFFSARMKRHEDFDISIFRASCCGEDWVGLDSLIRRDSLLSDAQKEEYFSFSHIRDKDAREKKMSATPWYRSVRSRLYPELRSVKLCCHMHRRDILKDTIHTSILDTIYMSGVQAIKDSDYGKALEILAPYSDYNTAVAMCAKDMNYSALSILSRCKESAQTHYLTAMLLVRTGKERDAVLHYLKSCEMDSRFIYRGNLDPEINHIINTYNIKFNQQ